MIIETWKEKNTFLLFPTTDNQPNPAAESEPSEIKIGKDALLEEDSSSKVRKADINILSIMTWMKASTYCTCPIYMALKSIIALVTCVYSE